MNEKQPQAGDKVRISTVKEDLEGTLIESYEPGIILVKLSSGYNIGIKKEDITGIKLLSKQKEESKNETTPEKISSNLKKIDIIITGGTISSRLDPATGAVKWLTSPADLFKFYPEIFSIADVRKIERPFMKASENMDSKDWIEIARLVEKSLNDPECQGVIITHGTDFLHYTSAALSFFLRELNKPVVLTYAQRSSDRASSDASLNLQCAARAAVSDIAEVIIVGHASANDDFCYALRGNKVRKMHTSRRDTFKPVNCLPIAKIFPDKIEKVSQHKIRNPGKIKLDAVFNERIGIAKFYPGMKADIFDYYSGQFEGMIIETSGLGHVATAEARNNLLPAIKKAMDNGMIVCASPQTIFGRLDPLVYSPGRELLKAGIIFLGDMLSETAYVKLGWVLAHKNWKGSIKEKMLENFAGELNDRLVE